MGKLKIKKSVSKRFKVTKTGKVLHGKQMRGHLRSNKSKSNLRRKKIEGQAVGTFAKKIKQLLGV
jgi:large subunit ribosomal protein L35